jgi:hypothetical protein
MNRSLAGMIFAVALALMALPVFAQQSHDEFGSQTNNNPDERASNGDDRADSSAGSSVAVSATPPQSSDSKSAPTPSQPHKLGPLTISVNWRFRTEAWDWFQPRTGQPAYSFDHSLLKIAVGQNTEKLEWLLEGAQDSILNLPTGAILPGLSGQLGLGAGYFAANSNGQNNANGFVRQAFVGFTLPYSGKLKLGRFKFVDGMEVTPTDASLATLINTRITRRLITDSVWTAVGRSFDGAQLSFNAGGNNLTFLGARSTQGVLQIDSLGEIAADFFYGAFTVPVKTNKSAGELRIFSMGYVDERGSVLKADNRPLAVRSADTSHIRLGTYGADYAHVFNTLNHGKYDFFLWGAIQNGSWGVQAQHAGSFVGELGWQPELQVLHPWFRLGYSYGSGDSNPNDGRHTTFFQPILERDYARFPFFNTMNNENFYGISTFRLPHSFVVRSELHALRLVSAQDLWYSGAGAFQPKTFGLSGRSSGGSRSLANFWDVSLDVPLRHGFGITTYFANAWGKGVISNIYPGGTNARFGYVETNYHF